jgi:hypothetical protein
MSSDTINVYWAPDTTHERHEVSWNLLYPEPITLFNELLKQKNSDAGTDTFFSCPATSAKYKKTYVFRNVVEASYNYDFTNENKQAHYIEPISPLYLNTEVARVPTISSGPLINFNLSYCFFADQPLEASFTPPMFHKPKYTHYGTIIPGQFDIGQWFRPYNFEVQMWDRKGQFHLETDEPIYYVEFRTEKKIQFHRFESNSKIYSYQEACARSRGIFGSGMSLVKRYQRFNDSKMRELILKEIKANVLE